MASAVKERSDRRPKIESEVTSYENIVVMMRMTPYDKADEGGGEQKHLKQANKAKQNRQVVITGPAQLAQTP